MSSITAFDPEKSIGDNIAGLSRRSLCELVSALCAHGVLKSGVSGYNGGIYPANISADDEGNAAIGEGRMSGWEEDELRFVAPELFWHGEAGPAADVYSMGMLLYFGVNGGKLPFEDGYSVAEAQQMRMTGAEFPIPGGTGLRLGDIIRKATAFKASERYANLSELKAMLDSVTKDLYLSGAPAADSLFGKSAETLSPIERMMLSILAKESEDAAKEPAFRAAPVPEREDETPEEEAEPEAAETDAAEVEAESETAEEPEEVPVIVPVEAGDIPEQPEDAAEVSDENEEQPIEDESEAESEGKPAEDEVENPEEAPAEDAEAPTAESGEEAAEAPAEPEHEPIPILEVEEHPELEPVVVNPAVVNPAVQYSKSVERERKIADKVKRRRRRPIIFILAICALLIISAMIFNAVMHNSEPELPEPVVTPTPSFEPFVPETPSAEPEPTPTPEPTPEAPKVSTYQVVIDNISWSEARERCREMGGHLVTITDSEEFNKIVELADSYGLRYVWIGCHRVDDLLVWEDTTEPTEWFWDYGEPSGYDAYTGETEDYVVLWYHNGWYYNDSTDFPEEFNYNSYSGRVGFICEFEN